MKIFKHNGRHLATAAGALAAGLLATAALTGTAYADTLSVTPGTQAYWISPGYDSLNISVAGGSTAFGTRIIQWPNDGGAEQKWFFDAVSDSGTLVGYMIRNDNSGMCIWTDDQVGDTLYQGPCDPDSDQDVFGWHAASTVDNFFIQAASPNLALDVSGDSYNWGADIDGWYATKAWNQDFFVTATSS
ncbi:MAG: RICIN domain-containing protein [Streptosporangiaceae bacterium]|jgi:hypothetical protein